MNPPEVIQAIKEIIGRKILLCDVNSVDDSMLANLDSLGRITLMVELENHYNQELTGENFDLKVFSSLSTLADFVSSKHP